MMFKSASFFVCVFIVAVARPREPQCSQYDFAEKTLEKVVRFEHNNELNNKKIEDMERSMQSRLETLNEEMWNRLGEKENKIDSKVQEIEDEVVQIREFKEVISKTLTEFKTEITEMLENQKKAIQLRDQSKTQTILFKAKDAIVSSLSNGDVIVFPTDVMNVGGAYNNKTGVFTAPVKGVYMFTAQFCIYVDKYLIINIVAGDKIISASHIQQASYNAVCHTSDGVTVLEQGDDVTVTLTGKSLGGIIYLDSRWWTSFSGVLLH